MDAPFLLSGAERDLPVVKQWFAAQPPGLGDLAERWFERIRARGEDVLELMHDGCPTACIGEAAFAYVGVYSLHVNIGFFRGADLPDPAGLLQGSGKRMRHVKLAIGKPLDEDAIEQLIDTAYRDMKKRIED